MEKVLFIAPHPDDETLGCGGTIFKHKEAGDSINWLLISEPKDNSDLPKSLIKQKKEEINNVTRYFKFDNIIRLKLEAAKLESYPLVDLTKKVLKIFHEIKPTIVYLPFPGDAHTDHEVVFKMTLACCKWFRFSGIKSIRAYETVSETNFNFNPIITNFRPNLFINISKQIEKKLSCIAIYKSEISDHPFPRSSESIKSLAKLRGSESGFPYAEAFLIIKQVEN